MLLCDKKEFERACSRLPFVDETPTKIIVRPSNCACEADVQDDWDVVVRYHHTKDSREWDSNHVVSIVKYHTARDIAKALAIKTGTSLAIPVASL